MKKQFLAKAMLLVVVAISVFSCGKKESMSMGGMDINMNYSPNPAVKNTPIAFTFEVKQDGVYKAVTKTECEVIMKSDGMESIMPVTEKQAGQYTGTYSFPEAGTYELHFKYMHENVDTDKDFSIVVQ